MGEGWGGQGWRARDACLPETEISLPCLSPFSSFSLSSSQFEFEIPNPSVKFLRKYERISRGGGPLPFSAMGLPFSTFPLPFSAASEMFAFITRLARREAREKRWVFLLSPSWERKDSRGREKGGVFHSLLRSIDRGEEKRIGKRHHHRTNTSHCTSLADHVNDVLDHALKLLCLSSFLQKKRPTVR